MEEDIQSTDDPVFAAQIFAEMLAAVAHPEFTSLDQEVPTSAHYHSNDRLSLCLTVTPDFNYIIASSLEST